MSLLRKPITNLRIGTKGYCSDRVGKESIFARFLELFDFRFLQQYLPRGDITHSIQNEKAANQGGLKLKLGNVSDENQSGLR